MSFWKKLLWQSSKNWSGYVQNVCAVKSKKEITFLKKSAQIASIGFLEIRKCLKPGLTEKEIFQTLKSILKALGSEKEPFDFVVGSGARGCNPHAIPSDKKIIEGEPIVLDFGAVYRNYCSDLTRTVCLGQPPEKLKEIYAVVLEAQKKALEALRPGQTGQEIDAIARQVIAAAGYEDAFPHGLGHGVGFEVHQTPSLRPKESAIIKSGMCLTVEPGIYLAGWGGVRIEDMVIVTESGCEVITSAPREL